MKWLASTTISVVAPELAGYSKFVKAEPEVFTIFNPRKGFVVIVVSGVYDGSKPRRFDVEVRDIDQNIIGLLRQVGRQAMRARFLK